MPNQIISAPPIGESPKAPVINPEGARIKIELVFKASGIVAIADEKQRNFAIATAGSIKAHLNAVEKQREEIKSPFWKMGQAIDKAAKEHVKELDDELRRINRLTGEFEAERERKLQAEQERRNQEALDLIEKQKEHEQEAKRIADDRAAREAKLAARGKELSPADKAKALQAELAAEEAQEDLEAQQRKLEADRIAAAEQARQGAASGIIHRYEIEITPTNLMEVLQFNRGFVTLALNVNAVKFAINTDPNIKIPGLTFERRPIVTTKASV